MKSMFEALTVGSMSSRNSIVRAATAESLATSQGCPTPILRGRYEELASGGVGTIITGYAYVTPDGKPSEGALGIYDDSFAGEYRELVESVHALGARIVLQLVYGGSKSKLSSDDARLIMPESPAEGASVEGREALAPSSDSGFAREPGGGSSSRLAGDVPNVRIIGPSSIMHPKTGLVPMTATHDDLNRVADAFGSASARAQSYGFDGVEIHCAHGYLISQFLSRTFNARADEYGGSLRNRARFAVQCAESARRSVGANYPLLVKLNSCDSLADPMGEQGGLSEDECVQVAAMLEEAGASCIDVSGDWHAATRTLPDGVPYFAEFGARLADAVRTPVIVTGGWRSVESIERHLAGDGISGIAMSRPLICEPDLVNRWQSGDARPSRCTSCTRCAQSPGIQCVLR